MHRSQRFLLLVLWRCVWQASTAAYLLLRHVNGYTLDGSGKLQRFEALLVDHGKVVATGGD